MTVAIVSLSFLQQKRSFSLHEYQSMALLKGYSVPIPNFTVVSTTDEAVKASQTFSEIRRQGKNN